MTKEVLSGESVIQVGRDFDWVKGYTSIVRERE